MSVISSLEERKISEPEDKKFWCPVAFSGVAPGKISVLACGHMFDEKAIAPWLKDHGSCPLCEKRQLEVFSLKSLPKEIEKLNDQARQIKSKAQDMQNLAHKLSQVEKSNEKFLKNHPEEREEIQANRAQQRAENEGAVFEQGQLPELFEELTEDEQFYKLARPIQESMVADAVKLGGLFGRFGDGRRRPRFEALFQIRNHHRNYHLYFGPTIIPQSQQSMDEQVKQALKKQRKYDFVVVCMAILATAIFSQMFRN